MEPFTWALDGKRVLVQGVLEGVLGVQADGEVPIIRTKQQYGLLRLLEGTGKDKRNTWCRTIKSHRSDIFLI